LTSDLHEVVMGAGTTGHATRIQVYPATHVASALKRELIDRFAP